MSTITGVSPNAVHISTPNQDLANQAGLARERDKNAFAPVEESNQTANSRNQPGEDPSREAERRVDREIQALKSRSRNPQPDQNIEKVSVGVKSIPQDDSGSASPVVNRESPTTTPQTQPQTQPQEQPQPAESRAVESRPTETTEPKDIAQQQEQARQAVDERREQRELQSDQQQIADLKQRDREVRDHEQAHKAVGGQYAGAMSLQYERGPDGVNYAVAGEVQINLSRSADNPEADLIKAQQVRQAALAPAEPSAQDRAVAAAATQLALDAQERIRSEDRAAETQNQDDDSDSSEVKESENQAAKEAQDAEKERSEAASERTKEQLDEILNSTREAAEKILEVHQIEEHRKSLGKLIDFEV